MEIVTREPLRIGVIGCAAGRVRYGAALAASPEITMAALVDSDEVAARVWAREIGGKTPVFNSTEAFLNAPLACDAVLIAVPLPERAEALRQSARAGKAILCEVPFAPTLPETDEVLKIAVGNSVLLMPALPLRFDPSLREMTHQAEAGLLGLLKQARCDWTYPREGGQTVENARLLLEYIASQVIDLCRHWMGQAVSVSADIVLPVNMRRDETLATILLTYPEGQATLRLASSTSPQSNERFTLVGAQSTLERVSGASIALAVPQLTRHRADRSEEPVFYADAGPGVPLTVARRYALLHHFASCVQGSAAPEMEGADIRAAQEILTAAIISAKEGIKVSLPLRASAGPALLPPPKTPSFRALPSSEER